MLKCIIMNWLKTPDAFLKAVREKQHTIYNKGTTFRKNANLVSDMIKVRRQWDSIFHVLRGTETINPEFHIQ